MILVITTVKQGGMPQFAVQIYESLINLGIDSRLFIPKSNEISIASSKEILHYDLGYSMKQKRMAAKKISEEIEILRPDSVWFADETTTSLLTASMLNKKYNMKFFVHDVNPHVYSFSLKRTIRNFFLTKLRKKVFKKAQNVVLMSKSSKDKFLKKYPKYKSKTQIMRLGAHVPIVEEKKPKELIMDSNERYFLFFGSIEKYKNIIGLLRSYDKFPYKEKIKLLIAGKGQLSENEQNMINTMGKSVILMNRFIEDGEMIYLFKRALVTILPYIEASQSGVLAMGYYFGVPTIVSNLPGLAENVVDDETGFVCNNEQDITDALIKLSDIELAKKMGSAANQYSNTFLDFTTNVRMLISN